MGYKKESKKKMHHPLLCFPNLAFRIFPISPHHGLDGDGGLRGDLLRESQRVLEHFVARSREQRHHAQLVRFLARDRFPGKKHAGRLLMPYRGGEKMRRGHPAGDPERGEGDAELVLPVRHANVASESDEEARADRGAVDRGNDGDRAVAHREPARVEGVHHPLVHGLRKLGPALQRRD